MIFVVNIRNCSPCPPNSSSHPMYSSLRTPDHLHFNNSRHQRSSSHPRCPTHLTHFRSTILHNSYNAHLIWLYHSTRPFLSHYRLWQLILLAPTLYLAYTSYSHHTPVLLMCCYLTCHTLFSSIHSNGKSFINSKAHNLVAKAIWAKKEWNSGPNLDEYVSK